MSEAGQNEKALAHAQQALEIRQRLAQKNPARFAEGWFTTDCNTQFLEWLADPADKGVVLHSIPETTPLHRRPRLLLYQAFLQACRATEDHTRGEAFKQVLTIWGDISQADRTSAQDYWLCAAAWCAKFEPSVLGGLDWQADWHLYVSRRKGNLPQWMHKLAQRLGFEWPV